MTETNIMEHLINIVLYFAGKRFFKASAFTGFF